MRKSGKFCAKATAKTTAATTNSSNNNNNNNSIKCIRGGANWQKVCVKEARN